MAVARDEIKNKLSEKFGQDYIQWDESSDIPTFEIPANDNLKVLQFLYEEEGLGFRFLTDLCAVHFPDDKGRELAVVYHMYNMVTRERLRIKLFVDEEQPNVYTATSLFPAANWQEREAYDFFGINFVGHPNLKRIMNVEEMDYFPMRKQYPLEDQSRIDKDDEMFGRGSANLQTIKEGNNP